ncbi:FAD-binding oxidoreductase [Francisella tularensis subsp. novicida]|nr:FAD-binding protein [Francisella tularensis]ABK90143.1 FAD binding family protein [Francisella tularensis subsp. novicida U112]AJI61753.1 berberine and berberine like family protein [Francisella tularensis subsp. novicida U112]MBK2036402.1 FAD-binding oxidoreductase [Francisella tularensis subsp. novicida]MBK2117036.1 FAD-binding oxidoreductase [Francisella tularensis subsp. novicida]MBK2311049.1 FAD-binding oxidoreductase [Francisella tularensis subsp. novicida]
MYRKITISCVLVSIFALANSQTSANLDDKTLKSNCRCLPSKPCWPDQQQWDTLAKSLKGKLIKPISPFYICEKNSDSEECKSVLQNIKNPFYMQSDAGRNESQGWYGAWYNQSSSYAVEVEDTQDIVKAVNFAREYNLRIVIKGAGHDYLGRSSSPDALLIWTHNMRDIEYNKHFHPQNCPKNKEYSAVTVGAGTRWLEAYNVVTSQHHQYVQGGGCTTVGAAGGFPQGGGFGSWSKEYGTGAGGIVQAEVVTADGKVMIANECQNQDLFWAIKGGGGGTYGIVTNLTLRTHKLPSHFGLISGEITADSDKAYKNLIKEFLLFYSSKLNNEHWGEQFAFRPNNKITIAMVTQGLAEKEALDTWQPFKEWLKSQSDIHYKLKYIDIPPAQIWNYDFWHKNYPDMVIKNTAPDARDGEFWWASNTGEVSAYWYTYQSWYLPKKLFDSKNIDKTVDTFYKVSQLAPVSIQINKGLAGASKQAIQLTKQTSMHPGVYDAGALAIMSYSTDKPQFGKPKMTPEIKQKVDDIYKAMNMIIALAPDAGTYANEADYFQKNWQQVFWGSNYSKLLKIKNKYDPNGLFYCHHCVGSEYWQQDGMCRK